MMNLNPLGLDKNAQEAVVAEVIKGDKIKAVQIAVKASGKGLKLSKDFVDQLWEAYHS